MTVTAKESCLLDFIRASAAQVVLIGHAVSFNFGFHYLGYLASFGVLIFFFISGYLIAGSAQRTRASGNGFKHFFIDRFARIYSAFIPSLILIAAIDFYYVSSFGWQEHVNSATISIRDFISNLLMLQSAPAMNGLMNKFVHGASQFGSGRPLWTLAFEWWLYMSFGMIYFLRSKIFEWKWLLLFFFVAFVPISNMMAQSKYSGGLSLVWVLGSLLWFSRPYWSGIEKSWAKTVAILATTLASVDFAAAVFTNRPFNIYDLNFMIVICIALCAMLILSDKSTLEAKSHSATVSKFLADYSYTLYLIHYSIIYLLIRIMNGYPNMVVFFACIILANILALTLSTFTEARHKELARLIRKRIDPQPAD